MNQSTVSTAASSCSNILSSHEPATPRPFLAFPCFLHLKSFCPLYHVSPSPVLYQFTYVRVSLRHSHGLYATIPAKSLPWPGGPWSSDGRSGGWSMSHATPLHRPLATGTRSSCCRPVPTPPKATSDLAVEQNARASPMSRLPRSFGYVHQANVCVWQAKG
jgi:hypothetical protein